MAPLVFFLSLFESMGLFPIRALTGNCFDNGREKYLQKEKSSGVKLNRRVDSISQGWGLAGTDPGLEYKVLLGAFLKPHG